MGARWHIGVSLAVLLVVVGAGCTSVHTNGPRKKVCGSWVARPNASSSAEWYVDASAKSPTRPIQVPAVSPAHAGTWIRVAASCDHGAVAPSVVPASAYAIRDSVRGAIDGYVAIYVVAVSGAPATLTIGTGQALRRISLTSDGPKTASFR